MIVVRPSNPKTHRECNGASASSTICAALCFPVRRTVRAAETVEALISGLFDNKSVRKFLRSAARSIRSGGTAGILPAGGAAGGVEPLLRSRLFNSYGPFQVARHLIPSLLSRCALQACQQTACCVSKAFHLALSAGTAGLAASVGRTPTSQKENRKCPKMQWRNPK